MAIRFPTFATFLWFLLCITPSLVNANNTPDGEIEVHLKEINNQAAITKTFVSPYGDVVDCIPSLLQPAFSHPSMKGKKLLDPPEIPKELLARRNDFPNNSFQSWMENQESCPRGTIPIRRTTTNELSRTSKTTSAINYNRNNEMHQSLGIDSFTRLVHKIGKEHFTLIYVYAIATQDGSYYGTEATVNVWSPYVAPHNEFSLAQIWLSTGSYNTNLETIEAGWQVYPHKYGDSNPRLFVYWTADSYKKTGCYDLECPGFVQTNNRIILGSSLSPTSAYGGKQAEITISIWKNNKNGNWWLSVQDEVVGYWPTTLYRSSFKSATELQFGGEVAYLPSANHTTTDMGSGRFPIEGIGEAAYFRNLETLDFNGTLHPISSISLGATRQECYAIAGGLVSEEWGQHFFYGGGGQSEICM